MEPRIAGKPATREDAYARAAALLRDATQPLFAGLGTDVDGMRAVLSLADRTGGIVDHMHGAAMAANVATVQGHGWMTTTLSEVKNRADLLLFIGTDAVRHHPRFFERMVWDPQSLFGLASEERTVIYLGPDLDTQPGVSPGRRNSGAHPLRARAALRGGAGAQGPASPGRRSRPRRSPGSRPRCSRRSSSG